MRYLLDTHVLLRWLAEPNRLTKEQRRILIQAEVQGQRVGLSAVSLIEIAVLLGKRAPSLKRDAAKLFAELNELEMVEVIPVDPELAPEIAALVSILQDPADSTIVATARVHGLQLLTSDQRILDSGLVTTVE